MMLSTKATNFELPATAREAMSLWRFGLQCDTGSRSRGSALISGESQELSWVPLPVDATTSAHSEERSSASLDSNVDSITLRSLNNDEPYCDDSENDSSELNTTNSISGDSALVATNNNNNDVKPAAYRPHQPRRQQLWSALGGRRAQSIGWLPRSPLPSAARTETEVIYERDGKPLHRIVYTIERDDDSSG
jgi:hypothetical protein